MSERPSLSLRELLHVAQQLLLRISSDVMAIAADASQR